MYFRGLVRSCLPALVLVALATGCKRAPQEGTSGQEARLETSKNAGGERSVTLRGREALLASGRLRVESVQHAPFDPNAQTEVPGAFVTAPSGTAEIGALIAGRASQVLVDEGDRVAKGALLATVEAPEAARTAADLTRAAARIPPLEKRVARYEALATENAAVPMQLDDLRGELASARAEVAASRTLLRAFGASEAGVVLVRAPFAGTVASRTIAVGGAVAPDKTLFTLLADDALVIAARWPEQATPPAVGAAVRLTSARDSHAVCTGRVGAVLPLIDPLLRTRTVRIATTEPCPFALVGAEVRVRSDHGPDRGSSDPKNLQSTLTIPRSAVVDLSGVPSVFVERGERFFPRAVRLGAGTTTLVSVESGLTDGERVVTEGAVLVKGELSLDPSAEERP